MKRNVVFFTLLIFFLLFTLNNVFAQRGGMTQGFVEVRLASPLPRNSDWGRQLERLASEWARVTNNQVRLRVIHDGLEGSESKMFSSLNADNIQMGLFLSTGLSEICPAVMTMSIPFLIKTDEELDLVLKDVLPVLESQLSRTNFVPIAWAKAGWVRFFTKEAIYTPDDMRRQKVSSSDSLKEINTVFRTMGFQIVEGDITSMATRLANNLINAIYLSPEAIAPLGLHRYLNNMLDMSVAPVMGALVMNRVTWNKISAAHQAEIVRVTQIIASEFASSLSKASANAVTEMRRSGLVVNKPTAAQEELWQSEINRALPPLLGTAFDRAIYNQINDILARARNRR